MQKYLIVWKCLYLNSGSSMAGGQIVIETGKDPFNIAQQLRNDLGRGVIVSIISL